MAPTAAEPIVFVDPALRENGTTILLVVGTGGFTHAAPVLELGRILAKRGHRIEFATHKGQQKWVEDSSFDFVSRVHTMGEPMDPEFEKAHYLHMQQTDPRKDYREFFRPKFNVDAFWAADYAFLKDIVGVSKPDMIVADFFVDSAVRDMQIEFGVPITTVWPQMPYGMAGASYIPGMPGFQVDALSSEHASLWTRIRAAVRPLRALPAILPYLRFVRKMRREAGVDYALPLLKKPDYLVLVNSFWGLETPKDLPPLVAAVGPILSDEYPPLDDAMEAFYSSHHRVLYASFGTHIQVLARDLEKLLTAFAQLMQEGLVDGIIWAANDTQRGIFARDQKLPGDDQILVGDILENRHPSWLFSPFAPQRAILARRETVLFATHGGGSSVNEALFHGTPMLTLGFFFDQPLNGLRIQEAGVGFPLDKASFSAAEVLDKGRRILIDSDGTVALDVRRMQHITQVSSHKKEYAADLIEELLYDTMYSLNAPRVDGGRDRRRPIHLQTADMRMSAWRAQNWDLTFLGALSFSTLVGLPLALCLGLIGRRH